MASCTSLSVLSFGGLQTLSPDHKWRWVRDVDCSGEQHRGHDGLFIGGFYTPVIHHVVQPPHGQRVYNRLGAFYFSTANDDVLRLCPKGNNLKLLPLTHSLVLQRVSIERGCAYENVPLAGEWRKETTISYRRVALGKGSENTRVPGVTVQTLGVRYIT
ncbi:hypothetical protein HD554DRAFT_2301528 [Boletus coccyginus]|nr:hypothetical protein HD554DRAFT_2301528 [Boletus coccyginus]